jgi:hypothetical protein
MCSINSKLKVDGREIGTLQQQNPDARTPAAATKK